MTSEGVEINRLIDRVLKESRPIDTESLCVLAGEKVCFQHRNLCVSCVSFFSYITTKCKFFFRILNLCKLKM